MTDFTSSDLLPGGEDIKNRSRGRAFPVFFVRQSGYAALAQLRACCKKGAALYLVVYADQKKSCPRHRHHRCMHALRGPCRFRQFCASRRHSISVRLALTVGRQFRRPCRFLAVGRQLAHRYRPLLFERPGELGHLRDRELHQRPGQSSPGWQRPSHDYPAARCERCVDIRTHRNHPRRFHRAQRWHVAHGSARSNARYYRPPKPSAIGRHSGRWAATIAPAWCGPRRASSTSWKA